MLWNVVQTSTSLTLNIHGGDFNRDGVIDAADYIVWVKTKNMTVTNRYDWADGNGDKVIDDADLLIWRKGLGNSSSASGSGGNGDASVPEPSSAAVLCLLAMPFLGIRRRRK
jgi:hypothetical protein